MKKVVKKNASVGKATAYKTTAAPYIKSSSPAYNKLTPEQRNKNTQAQLKHDMAGSSSNFSGKTKVAYNKKNNTKTVVNYKADGTKQVKVVNYSKPAAVKKTPVKTVTKTPIKTAYDVLKDKQSVIKSPRVGTPVKGTVTTNPKKTITVKKSTVKTNPTKTVEETVTPSVTKKVSEITPSVSSTNISPVTNNKSTPDRIKAPVKKATSSMGEKLTGYKAPSKPVANTTTNTPAAPIESAPAKISLIDKIKSNLAQRKLKKMNKLSEQVDQSRAMGSYAQPTMKKGGVKKYQKGGTKKPIMNPAKIKVTPGSKKPSYNEVFKTKKK